MPAMSNAQTKLGTFKPILKVEAFAGPSMSFGSGKFIKDHKEFSEVNYSDATISGKISPVIFFAAGGQGRVILGPEDLLSKFSVSLGLFYSKRGFTHAYSFTANNNGLNINDKMEYKEKYAVNNLSVPILIRYGNKWFAEIGPSIDHFLSATRKQFLKREVSGSDAFDGGFSTSEKVTFTLNKALFAEHRTGLIIGLGRNFTDRSSIRITNHFFSKTFAKGSDFKNYSLQLELIINVLKPTKDAQ
jgi:hypothetical protein